MKLNVDKDDLRVHQSMCIDWDAYFKNNDNNNRDRTQEGLSADDIIKSLCGDVVILLDLLWWHAGPELHNEWRVTSRILLDSIDQAYHALPSYALHLWRRLAKIRVMNKLQEHCRVLSYYFEWWKEWWKETKDGCIIKEEYDRMKKCGCIYRYPDVLNKSIAPFAQLSPPCWRKDNGSTTKTTTTTTTAADSDASTNTTSPEVDNRQEGGISSTTRTTGIDEELVRYPPPFKLRKKRKIKRPYSQVDLQKIKLITMKLRSLLIIPFEGSKVSPIIRLHKDLHKNKHLRKLFVLLALLPAPNALSQIDSDKVDNDSSYLLDFNPLFIALILFKEGSRRVHQSLVHDSMGQTVIDSDNESNGSDKRSSTLNFVPILIAHGVILYPRRLSSLCVSSRDLLSIWVKSALEAYSFNEWEGLKIALVRASGTILGSKITTEYFTRILCLSRYLLPKYCFEELSLTSLTELMTLVQTGCDRKCGTSIFEQLISFIYELVTIELNKSYITEDIIKIICIIAQKLETALSEYLNLMVNKLDNKNIDNEYDEAALLLGKNELTKNILVAQVYYLLMRVRRELKLPEAVKLDVVIHYRNDILLSLASPTKSGGNLVTTSSPDRNESSSGGFSTAVMSSTSGSSCSIGTTTATGGSYSKVESLWLQIKDLLIQRE